MTRTVRPGYTILEMLLVLAILIILGAVSIPTLQGLRANTRVKAGGDMMRAFLAEARRKAIEDGEPYRLAISADGRRLRVSADHQYMGGGNPSDTQQNATYVHEDDLPDQVTAELLDASGDVAQDSDGWKRVATFLSDGTCKETLVQVQLTEPDVAPVLVRLRGLTGTVKISGMPSNANGGK